MKKKINRLKVHAKLPGMYGGKKAELIQQKPKLLRITTCICRPWVSIYRGNNPLAFARGLSSITLLIT